jgi:ABC-2 type transport system permease protein
MKNLLALYIQQFKTTTANMFQYRAALLIWMIGQVLEPLVYLIVWSAVANVSNGVIGGYSTTSLVTYFIILMLVNQFTYTWIMYEFEYRIREGTLSFALLRPVHPIHSDIADNISSKIITLPVMILVALGLGFAFHAVLDAPVWAIFLFIPVLFIAFAIRFLLEWTLAQVAFWTTRVSAVNQTYFILMLFLSGQLAPLAFFPKAVQVLANILPFHWMLGFPVELLINKLSFVQAIIGLGAQLAWLIAGIIILQIVWRAGTRAYTAVGQ